MNLEDGCLKFSFDSAGLIVGIAALLLIIGNVGVILGLFLAHVAWTVYTLLKYDTSSAPSMLPLYNFTLYST